MNAHPNPYAAFSPPGNRELVATTGFFDGVHLGHFAVLRRVLELAREQGKDSAVVTFWPHPRVILHQDSNKVRLLHSLDEKKQRLQRLGIDHVLVLPFTPAFAQLSPAQFVKEYLHRQFRITTLVAGYDHHLGANAGADYEQLRQIGKAINMAVEYVGEIKDDTGQVTVSSTKIREALAQGDTGAANQLLGYCYSLQGVVVEGQRLGRQLGFPTANMQLYEPLKQLPANGVYATRVRLNDRFYGGMTNIGFRPTVQPGDTSRTIETHIFHFADDIYGQDLTVHFLERIRSEQRFDSLDALVRQLQRDRETCGRVLSDKTCFE